jgi:hypothetical protein
MMLPVKAMAVLLPIVVLSVIVIGVLVLGTSLRTGRKAGVVPVRHLREVPAEAWTRLGQRTMFFGHQSVGRNIMDGIRDLVAESAAVNVHIVETKDAGQLTDAVFACAPIGRNWEPESKLAEFRRVLEDGLGDKVDVAFLKFCYVDVRSDSDPVALLDAYVRMMEALNARFPNVTFVHLTVPLRAPPDSVKGILKVNLKRVLGRATVLDDNGVRACYNDLLRERFSAGNLLFDLAGYESTGPDGAQWFVSWKGHEVPVLVPSYTDDGGHLNAQGRRHVAEQLLIELAKLAEAGR